MIYVVSGHPRSGTSMMMAALEAGGLKVVASASREALNRPDGPYKPNHGGLYEPAVHEMWQPGWPRKHEGCALKVVVQWLRHLAVHEYRVVMMERDPEEIRQSYRATGLETTAERIEQEMNEAYATLQNRADVKHVRTLWYADVLADPLRALSSLCWPIDARQAAKVVDPEQYRFRRERLVVGL